MNIETVQKRICKIKEKIYHPELEEHNIYSQLYGLYKSLHDAFGVNSEIKNLYIIMKNLLEIKKSLLSTENYGMKL